MHKFKTRSHNPISELKFLVSEDPPLKEKLNFRGLLLVAGLFIVFLLHGCGDLHHAATDIEVNAANDFVTGHEDAVILDVRTRSEFEKSHINLFERRQHAKM